MTPGRQVRVLGVRLDALTVAEAIDMIAGRAADFSSPPAYVIKPYVEFFELAVRSPAVAEVLNGAWLSLADGVAAQWAAAYEKQPRHGRAALVRSLAAVVARPASLKRALPERVAGITFTMALLERCAQKRIAVHLVGSPKRSSIQQTAQHLQRIWPELRLTGATVSPVTVEDESQLLAELQIARPDVILVGSGFPRQEFLMARLCGRLEHGVLIGEGGSFDYAEFGGHLRRAPAWMRRSGIEWLWRLALEPRRLGRQLAIPRFIWRVQRRLRARGR